MVCINCGHGDIVVTTTAAQNPSRLCDDCFRVEKKQCLAPNIEVNVLDERQPTAAEKNLYSQLAHRADKMRHYGSGFKRGSAQSPTTTFFTLYHYCEDINLFVFYVAFARERLDAIESLARTMIDERAATVRKNWN